MKRKLLYIVNGLRAGAVPNILLDILPYISKEYEVSLLSLQSVTDNYTKKKFTDASIKVNSLKLGKRNIIKTFILLKLYLKKNKPDIIHSHLGRSDIYSSLCKGKYTKHITTFHSLRDNYNPLTRLAYTVTDYKVDFRTAVSNAVKDSWYNSNKLKSDSHTIYNPVSIPGKLTNDQKEKLTKELNIFESDYVITNVGNIRKQKGQIFLVRAMKILVDEFPNIKLIIVGRKGDAYDELLNEISSLNLHKHILLLGFRNDVDSILSISDVFVFPSVTEGLGISVLEAMAAGVPVVASDIKAISEYIENQKEGILVNYANVEKIASSIEKILKNSRLKEKLKYNAYKKVDELFNPKMIANQYMKLYNDI